MAVVDLDDLKLALGVEDDSEDATLALFLAQAVAWVEGYTGRRFDSPDERIEVLIGSGTRTLYLSGHIDDPDTTSEDVPVRERPFRSVWEDLDPDDYEVRGDALVRLDGYAWSPYVDYEVTYDDGFETAPADIQAVVIELVSILRTGQVASSSVVSGSAGITEEHFPDYSYKVDASAAQAAASAASSLSRNGLSILGHWVRVKV